MSVGLKRPPRGIFLAWIALNNASTVQPKAVVHPTDSRLLDTVRKKLVDQAKAVGIVLKQTVAKEDKQLTRQADRYARARQFRRFKKLLKQWNGRPDLRLRHQSALNYGCQNHYLTGGRPP
ncbi:hypothetical protein [Orrella marina]|uniref:hypothetical protein n=1 Tax=Orrella marina TaxID=2163011 RepID=UPI00131EF211|nr:hypothetical protein [Orrella marina]